MNAPPQRRRVVAAPARRIDLHSVRVLIEQDPDADVSYLEQDEFEDRLASYKRGEFELVGVRAQADVVIEGVLQVLESGGTYGIESDSEEEYFEQIFVQEWESLRTVLKTVGVPTDKLPLEVDRAWIEWKT
jgi:hypothetical protein